MFHLREQREDDEQLTAGLIQKARKQGALNLSGRGLTSGKLQLLI